MLPEISSLPLTKLERKIVDDFNALKTKSFNTDFEIYKNFENLNLESILMFSTIDKKSVEKYLDNLRNIELTINGTDLQVLGIPPSAQYQKCFDYILRKKIENQQIGKEQELELAKKIF